MSLRYDAVVAGSGAGGACVAGRLAAGGMKVLLLERGRRPRPGPAAAVVRRHYARGALVAAWGRGLIPVPTGSALGGTTAINSGTCLRPPPELTRSWERFCGGGFSQAGFARRVEQAWTALKVKRAPESTLSGSSRLALAGFRALGVAAEPLERAEDGCAGEGRCCFVCPRGAKMTADKAFLDVLPPGKGPELWTGAELESIAVQRQGGVRVSVGTGRRRESIETGLVVLACGALETPALVRRHRLGAWGLAGDNLSLHPALKLFGLFPEPVLPAGGVPQGVGAVHPRDPSVRLEGVATPPELTALTMPLEGARLRWWMERRARLATFGLMVKDAARGSVRRLVGRPLIAYSPAPQDLRGLARGLALAADAFFAAGAQRVLLPLNRPGNEAGCAEEAASALASLRPAELQAMAFHPLGTCAMGRVVGPDLRLAPNVYVADGSVVPESLGVNPQVTIYAFALSLAGRLLGEGP